MDIANMEVDEINVNGTTRTPIPGSLCGLDFSFHTFNKMYIQDIISLEPCNVIPGMYWYKTHPVYKVDIIGVVVKRQENIKCYMYAVDDGTGVITCCCWKSRISEHRSEEIESVVKGRSKLPKVLKEKMSAMMISENKKNEGYNLGDLIHVRGKIKIFREEREVVASHHSKLEDPNMEVVRMSELPVLYRTLYDVDTLPKKVAEELQDMSRCTDGGGQREIVPELKRILLTYIEEQQPDEIKYNHIHNLPEVTELLNKLEPSEERKLQLQKALTILEEEGCIFATEKDQVYEVLKPGCLMENAVMEILRRDCIKEKFQSMGCHYLHIVDEVRKMNEYRTVQNSCVLACLNNLEYRSTVIRTSFSHYLLCTI